MDPTALKYDFCRCGHSLYEHLLIVRIRPYYGCGCGSCDCGDFWRWHSEKIRWKQEK